MRTSMPTSASQSHLFVWYSGHHSSAQSDRSGMPASEPRPSADQASQNSTNSYLPDILPHADAIPEPPEGCYLAAQGSTFTRPASLAIHNHVQDPSTNLPAAAWDSSTLTLLPNDLVQGLLTVFVRQYIPYPNIRRSLLMRDFHRGDGTHYSAALLRSMCCLACRVLGGYGAGNSSYASLGNRLFGETSRLIFATTASMDCSIPDAQALGNLSLHQLGSGGFISARYMADESVRRLDSICRRQVREVQCEVDYATLALLGAISHAR